MIPATTPAVTATYDTWTPVAMSGEYLGPGVFRAALTLHRSRVIDAESGNTELYPDPDARVQCVVEDIYAPAYADEENPSLGAWWTAEVRAAVLAGDVNGAGTGAEAYKAIGNSGITRVTPNADEDGNRVNVSLNL